MRSVACARSAIVRRSTSTVSALAPRAWLLAHAAIPADLKPSWEAVTALALAGVRDCYARAGTVGSLRLHGDCHAGNVLWTDDGPHFVDFDDARSGPAIQDLWMLLSGESRGDDAPVRRRAARLRGLPRTRPAASSTWSRRCARCASSTTRHGSAQRWDDPAFPAAFPWFNTQRYWQDRILELREQVALMDEPPLAV